MMTFGLCLQYVKCFIIINYTTFVLKIQPLKRMDYDLCASRLMLIVTSLPNISPPLSKALLKVTP